MSDESQVGMPEGETLPVDLVHKAELLDVRVVKWHGELLTKAPSSIETDEISISIESSFRVVEEGFDCRYNVKLPIVSNGAHVANIEVATIASFKLPAGMEPSRDDVRAFMGSVGYFVAMPFIREAVQTMSVRLGLDALTLGLLVQGQDSPASATFRRQGPAPRRDGQDEESAK